MNNNNEGMCKVAMNENAKLREELDAVQKANFLVCQEATSQKERADKAEAERDEYKQRWNTQKETIKAMEGCYIEQQIKVVDSIKDKWIKKASKMPMQLECRSKGSSCYNWAMYYASEMADEI